MNRGVITPWRCQITSPPPPPFSQKKTYQDDEINFFVWFLKRPRQQLGYIADGSQDWRLTILRGATYETEQEHHDFCLSWSHYTDTNPTSSERAATAVIEPRNSSSGVTRSIKSIEWLVHWSSSISNDTGPISIGLGRCEATLFTGSETTAWEIESQKNLISTEAPYPKILMLIMWHSVMHSSCSFKRNWMLIWII